MFMEEILVIGITVILAIVGWLAKLVSSLKNGIDAQKSIIDSMASQSTYINNVQTTVSKLYEPSEIEKLVSAKTQQALMQNSGKYDEAQKNSENSLKSLYGYMAASITYLDERKLEVVFNSVQQELRNSELEEFAISVRKDVQKIYLEAQAKLLAEEAKT
jgi:hypothetical protein